MQYVVQYGTGYIPPHLQATASRLIFSQLVRCARPHPSSTPQASFFLAFSLIFFLLLVSKTGVLSGRSPTMEDSETV